MAYLYRNRSSAASRLRLSRRRQHSCRAPDDAAAASNATRAISPPAGAGGRHGVPAKQLVARGLSNAEISR